MRQLVCLAIPVCLLALVPRTAVAQERGAEVAFGYTFRYLSDSGGGFSLPLGFSVSAADRMDRLLSVVGELTETHRSETEGLVTASVNYLSFAGGVRVSKAGRRGPKRDVARPFVEFIVGSSRLSAGVSGLGSVTGTSLHLEPKGGVDVPMGRSASLRGAVALELEHASGWAHAVRFDIDAVFAIGRR